MDEMERTLSIDEAKGFYDRFGARQDKQAFYEDAATAELIAHARFADAETVMEFGCGTGRFAESLLKNYLAPECRYRGVDISTTMVGLARGRLARWAERATVNQTDGGLTIGGPDNVCDRFVINYVLDLLSADDTRNLLAEARRILVPGGLIGIVNLTNGISIPGQIVGRLWSAVFRINPNFVGGCRPIRARDFLTDDDWAIRHHAVVSRFGIASEICVAALR